MGRTDKLTRSRAEILSQRWRTLQRVMLSHGKIGDIAQAALVLVQFEHKMIT